MGLNECLIIALLIMVIADIVGLVWMIKRDRAIERRNQQINYFIQGWNKSVENQESWARGWNKVLNHYNDEINKEGKENGIE